MRLSIVGPLRGPIDTNANTPELRMNPKDGTFCAELTYIIAAYLPQVPLRYTCGQAWLELFEALLPRMPIQPELRMNPKGGLSLSKRP